MLNHPQNRAGKHTPAGFSLVELLVVISVIAVLTALILPSLSAARSLALETRCQANVRQVGLGVITYSTDFADLVPPHFNKVPGTNMLYQGTKAPDTLWAYHAGATTANGPYKLRAGLTWPDYVGNARIFYCPDSRNASNGIAKRFEMSFGNSPGGRETGFKWFGIKNDYSGIFDVSYAFPAVDYGPITRTDYGGYDANTVNFWATKNFWQGYSDWGKAMVHKRVTENAGRSNPMLWDANTDGDNFASHNRNVTVIGYFDGSGFKYPRAQYIYESKTYSTYGARGFLHPSVLSWMSQFKVQGLLVP